MNTQERLDVIATTLIDFLNTTCQCTMSLVESRFQCFQDQNAVIFRAQVLPMGDRGAELLREYVERQPVITVDGYELEVDSSCATNISSFAAPGCSSTEFSDSGTEGGDLLLVIVMGIVSGVLVLAIVMATVLILTLLLRLSKERKLRRLSREVPR